MCTIRALSNRTTSRFRTAAASVLAVIAVACAAGPAAGQSADDLVPQPMSSRQLTRVFDWLETPPEQQEAVEQLHDAYLERFRRVRLGGVERLIKEIEQIERLMNVWPTRQQIEAIIDRQRQVMQRIASIEKDFFDQVAAQIGSDRPVLVERLRWRRERDRYLSLQRGMMGSRGELADISDLLAQADVPDDMRRHVEAIIYDYERRLTRNMAEQIEAVRNMMLDMFDGMAQMTDSPQSFEDMDAEEMQSAMDRQQQLMREVGRPILDLTAEARRMHRRAQEEIGALLPQREARTLQVKVWLRIYPEMGYLSSFTARSGLTRLRRSDELTDEQRSRIEDLLAEHDDRVFGLMKEFAEHVEAHKQDIMPMTWDEERREQFQEQQQDYQQRIREVSDAVMASALEIAGEVGLGSGQAGMGRPGSDGVGLPYVDDEDEIDSASEFTQPGPGMQPRQGSADPFVIDPLDAAALSTIARRLDLTRDQRLVMETLHEMYLEDCRTLREEGALAEAQKAASAMWMSADDAEQPPFDERLDRLSSARRSAVEAMEALEETFFDDIRASVLIESQYGRLHRIRAARAIERTMLAGTSMFRMGGGGTGREGSVNLLAMVLDLELPDEVLAGIEQVLNQYAERAVSLGRQRRDASMEVQIANRRFQEAMRRQHEEGGGFSMEAWEAHNAQQEPAREIVSQFADMNRQMYQQLAERLDDAHATQLERTYYRRAFPQAFSDPSAMADRIDQAIEFHDLSDDQRAAIRSLKQQYETDYDAVMNRLIDEYKASKVLPGGGFDPERWREQQRQRDRLDLIRFDRGELNIKTARRLRNLLDDDQVARLGLLPDDLRFAGDSGRNFIRY